MSPKQLYDIFLESTGVITDSRVATPGKIFFALRGENYDGHTFVEMALRKGCSKAVIDNNEYTVPGKTVLVTNVLTSLQQLARYHRQKFNIPVLAITGTNGKTTTKELAGAVLSCRYRTLVTRGNLNNHIGMPLTLLELSEYHQVAVIEMGANHIGEIELLCELAMPTHGLITNIGSAHLEGFGSPEGVKIAKSELFRYLKKTGGMAFLNYDSINLREIARELDLDCISYGAEEGLFLSGTLLNPEDPLELKVRLRTTRQSALLKTRLTGSYNFENIMAAACIGIYFGVSTGDIKIAVENYMPVINRSQIYKTSHNRLLLDAYNANPDSMNAAINNFFSLEGEKKSVILGDMLELGDYTIDEHTMIIELLKKQRCREVILVGEIFFNMMVPGNYLQFENVEKLTLWLKHNPIRDRFILLKGSRGIGLEKCIAVL